MTQSLQTTGSSSKPGDAPPVTSGLLYKSNQSTALSADLFKHPPAEMRGVPFWCWNEELDRGRLLRQLATIPQMGMGGVTIHPRTGLGTPFMGSTYLDHVAACVETGASQGQFTWLYDEDRWPSGFGGGLVTCDPSLRMQWLLITRVPYGVNEVFDPGNPHWATRPRNGSGVLLARWAVKLNAQGGLIGYRRLAESETTNAGEDLWYGLLETAAPSSWFNHQTYVDTLNPEATRRFTEVVHDRFYTRLGQYFGNSIPAVFTDEPQFATTRLPSNGLDASDCHLPWTKDLVNSHQAATGLDPLATLPELLWEKADGATSQARWMFRNHMAERFASAYPDVLGKWAQEHGVAFTGHLAQEAGLADQTYTVGETMRAYRSFQIPGIDVLLPAQGNAEYRTALQCRSAKHQDNREAMLSELYGVTDWDFPFAGYKAQGDWQATLGVTVRVHHLNWVSMRGEAKRDYPASIGYQSPWWREFPLVEDHFARLNTALTRGRPFIKVAVLHPLESFWITDGPRAETTGARVEQESRWKSLLEWLLHGLIDFDLISESRLPGLCPVGSAPLQVGAMTYDTIIVPPLVTVRSSTLERLERFSSAGGRLVFLGTPPALVDVCPSLRAKNLATRAMMIACERESLLAALEPARFIDVRAANGVRPEGLMYHMRQDGERKLVFICNPDQHGIPYPDCSVRLRGHWDVECLHTDDGRITPAEAVHEEGWTLVPADLHPAGHVLFSCAPARSLAPVESRCTEIVQKWIPFTQVDAPLSVTLDEPNVLLLDQGEWRIADEPWQPVTELLRADTQVRARLGLPVRDGNDAQPWTNPVIQKSAAPVSVRFALSLDAPLDGVRLVVEDPEELTISLDGLPVMVNVDGYWVDEALVTIPLPALCAGAHQLELTRSYRSSSSLEWCYLLGDFSVHLSGRDARLNTPVRNLAHGDWTTQGLPFYGGNVTYHYRVNLPHGAIQLQLPRFGGALARVAIDEKLCGRIAWAPWSLGLGAQAAGEHTMGITIFGHRRNCFGCVHLADDRNWISPNAWRTTGNAWTDDYKLKPLGLFANPYLMIPERGL